MRPSYRICWHKLRLFLLTQYQAVVALDSDLTILANIDDLVQKVLDETAAATSSQNNGKSNGNTRFWMAAHDETPLCESCDAEVSGAPNAGVFGLRPDRRLYEELIARSKKPSPWYGERWAYSEQELLSVFFLVEAEQHNSRMLWLDNAYNSFACKYACSEADRAIARTVGNVGEDYSSSNVSNYYKPAILHFVGVDKPSTLFVHADRRSRIVKALTKVDVAHSYVADHVQAQYQRWFLHLMGGLEAAFGNNINNEGGSSNNDAHAHEQLLWREPIKSQAAAKRGGSVTGGKRWVAFLHVPKTGGSALISSFMRALFGEWWFHLDCGASVGLSTAGKRALGTSGSNSGGGGSGGSGGSGGDSPPLCATYGGWVAPKERRPALKQRCTALGCLGHLPHDAMRTALGGEILKRTDFVTILRDPVKLFVSEYHYILDQLGRTDPSLQFVGDPPLLRQMMGGMPLTEYVDYNARLVKHGRSGLGSAFNRQTYFLTTASVDEMRFKSDEVFHEAAVKLNKMDFVGIMERMPESVRMLQCVLGVEEEVRVAKKNVGSYRFPDSDPKLLARIAKLLELDVRVYEFAEGLFKQRQKAAHFMRQYYRYC